MSQAKPLWRFGRPKAAYEAVVVGGGLHGLAAAYYLAKDHGFKRVAVLERKYFGWGGSGRNTEIIRVNQRAPEILPLYLEAKELWNGLSAELGFNLMVWMKGLIGLSHSVGGLNAMRLRHETLTRLGIENHILSPEEIRKLVPELDTSDRPALPILGGYFNPPGGQVRHDAAVWGFLKGCHGLGVDLCPEVEVTGIKVESGRVAGLSTSRGEVSAPLILLACGGYSSQAAELAGLRLPLLTLPLQAMVTEPLKPFLNHVIIDEHYFCYVHQSLKGDLIMGAHLDPWQSFKLYNTFEFAAEQAYFILELFPDLAHLKLMRSWSGLCDMTLDGSPIMGRLPVEGLFVDAGWGYFGFKSSPACGRNLAAYMATGRCPERIKFLGLERFHTGQWVQETYVARG